MEKIKTLRNGTKGKINNPFFHMSVNAKVNGSHKEKINGYENYYISNQGRCYNTKTKSFVGATNIRNYIVCVLTTKKL